MRSYGGFTKPDSLTDFSRNRMRNLHPLMRSPGGVVQRKLCGCSSSYGSVPRFIGNCTEQWLSERGGAANIMLKCLDGCSDHCCTSEDGPCQPGAVNCPTLPSTASAWNEELFGDKLPSLGRRTTAEDACWRPARFGAAP